MSNGSICGLPSDVGHCTPHDEGQIREQERRVAQVEWEVRVDEVERLEDEEVEAEGGGKEALETEEVERVEREGEEEVDRGWNSVSNISRQNPICNVVEEELDHNNKKTEFRGQLASVCWSRSISGV